MIPPLTYLDRYRNEGTRSYSKHADYTEARERYRPNAPFEGFDLKGFWVPREGMNVYAAHPSPEVVDRYLEGETCLLCVHPQLLEEGPDEPFLRRTRERAISTASIPVHPTSSTRTLCVRDGHPPHALKVHFPFRVSRYGRKMRDEVVEQAVNVSREMEAGIDALGVDFAFFREVLGITHQDPDPHEGRGENWGYLVREMTPFPGRGEDTALIPAFSLYGRDFFDPTEEILLWELMGDSHPLQWTLESLMLPIIRHWVACFLGFGFIMEPHGQNTLLESDPSGRVTRIVHRDLNVGLDMRRRRDLGLPEEGLNDYNRMESGEFNSIAYDKFMGGHFFDRVMGALQERHPGLRPDDLREPCREEFARLFPDHERYLPRTVHYFTEARDEFGKPLFQDTGRPPDWRP